MTLEGVPVGQIITVWSDVRHLIEQGLRNDNYLPRDILAALVSGDMQLWIMGRPPAVALVTEIVNYPQRRVCRLIIGAADPGWRTHWLPSLARVEAWAKAQGCQGMEVNYARKGWARLLKRKPKAVVLEWGLA